MAGQPVPALAGHALEQRLRGIVLGGLFPLLDVLVRGLPGAIRSYAKLDARRRFPGEVLALQQLELAVREELSDAGFALAPGLSRWIATELGRDVHQQLAVLRYQGLPSAPGSLWQDVLLFGWRRLDRGKRLLEWLRLGSLEARCFACDAQATGLCSGTNVRALPAWALACDRHRMPPQDWQIHAFDLGLDPVPDLAGDVAYHLRFAHGAFVDSTTVVDAMDAADGEVDAMEVDDALLTPAQRDAMASLGAAHEDEEVGHG